MNKAISLVQWNTFLRDWGDASLDRHGDSHAQTEPAPMQAMLALLQCQQRAADELKERGLLKPCREFTARFRATTWQRPPDDIRVIRIAEGVEYFYTANGRMCFNGKLLSIWDHDHGDAKAGNFIKLDKSLVHYKLDQFKNAFPEITYFWIALSSVVIAHFLSHEPKGGGPTACEQGLALLSQKVQFDQAAIEANFHRPADVRDVAYSVRHIEVGKYGTFTLSVIADETVLMRIELGLLQKVARTADIDILID